jgi:hypothetical protein
VIVIGGEALVDLVDENGATRAIAGGGPFNTAVALGRLEVPVGFLGTLSRDSHGSMLEQLLAGAGVDTSLVRWSNAPTPHAVVHRQQDGRNSYTFELAGTAFADLRPDELPMLPEAPGGTWDARLAIDPPAGASDSSAARPPAQGSSSTERPATSATRPLPTPSSGWPPPTSSSSATTMPAGYPGLTMKALESILALGPRLVALTRGATAPPPSRAKRTSRCPGWRSRSRTPSVQHLGRPPGPTPRMHSVGSRPPLDTTSCAQPVVRRRRVCDHCTRTGADPLAAQVVARLAEVRGRHLQLVDTSSP